ncbi:hypothetical protein [Nocardioides eburneiflavus]|uniref:hypothetical protein n=1 Tax=Nocardioides eburneiflavus TaxID=2518372 RepID=UPI001FE987A7|nr:hypothetical protein [Nocardioides eburneiflavus]
MSDSKVVDFDFAPVIGRDEGSTGSVSSSACRGSCGETLPNPMDIVFMADRTTSMAEDDREDMQAAIIDSLGVMDPTLHYVAFGAMHKSKATSSCATAATTASDGPKGGKWIAIDFSNDYKANRDAPISSSSKLVTGVRCMPNGAVPGLSTGSYGTHLASALKGASRYLLGLDPNNLGSLPKRPGTAKKVLIFETDGQPDELLEEGSTSITSSGDIGAGRNSYGNGKGKKGCDNLTAVAEQAKARGVTCWSSASVTRGRRRARSPAAVRLARPGCATTWPLPPRRRRPAPRARRTVTARPPPSAWPRTRTATTSTAPPAAPSWGRSSRRRSTPSRRASSSSRCPDREGPGGTAGGGWSSADTGRSLLHPGFVDAFALSWCEC